jgi:hypothetical protein
MQKQIHPWLNQREVSQKWPVWSGTTNSVWRFGLCHLRYLQKSIWKWWQPKNLGVSIFWTNHFIHPKRLNYAYVALWMMGVKNQHQAEIECGIALILCYHAPFTPIYPPVN